MAKGYVIAQMSVVNQDGYLAYSKQVPGTLEAFGGRFVVRGGEATPMDGVPKGPRNVVIEFPSLKAAQDWYNSPAYQAIVQGRLDNADGYLITVEGFEG
jgi:uncharacterized protein (DUF1330 family)